MAMEPLLVAALQNWEKAELGWLLDSPEPPTFKDIIARRRTLLN